EISFKKGVRISSTERPLLPKQVENGAVVKFRQAYVEAATALFKENLPGPDDDRSAVVDDKLSFLDQATWRLLTRFGWGGRKQVRIPTLLSRHKYYSNFHPVGCYFKYGLYFLIC
ncbi:hypothetical protein HZB97_00365, partial [Candidatus Gottesmanbacteria bacterium]|nr:hypothetical protein [Candidatus Gottesmanbacteria bacterium]